MGNDRGYAYCVNASMNNGQCCNFSATSEFLVTFGIVISQVSHCVSLLVDTCKRFVKEVAIQPLLTSTDDR